MAINGVEGSKHTAAHLELLDSLSARQLMDFRNHMYNPGYIAANTGILDHEWIRATITKTGEILCDPANRAVILIRCKARSRLPGMINAADFARLTDFTYIDSDVTLAKFSEFVYSISKKEITNWWKHKEMNAWIIPYLLKSQSALSADVWDSTPSMTNTNEAQHAWTNAQTGTKLAQRVDETVAEEIQMSLCTGIFASPNTTRKSRESRQLTDVSKELQMRLSAELEKRRESTELTKALKAAKKGSSEILTASSSGRVKTAPARSVPGHVPSTMPSENTTLFPTTHCSEPMSAFIPPQPAPDFSEFFMPSYDALPFGALTAPLALEFPPTISNIAPMEFSGIDFSTFDIDAFFGFDPTFITEPTEKRRATEGDPSDRSQKKGKQRNFHL
ncbi:hypothetical protein B0H17DRAFT_1209990 [Mycena rosella]|uniref:Uncharacterized protein n=1 Tax=Mycena rosella TaxID=1033263 RepID=A0AAD7G529_MYCRO|nr:hypothetical protein B0H17DRAFT_1209990 [Mycena rosella]